MTAMHSNPFYIFIAFRNPQDTLIRQIMAALKVAAMPEQQ